MVDLQWLSAIRGLAANPVGHQSHSKIWDGSILAYAWGSANFLVVELLKTLASCHYVAAPVHHHKQSV